MFSGEPGRPALLWAAVLRGGSGAALSYQTAAELHGLIRRPASLIHVTVPADRYLEHVRGLVIHYSNRAAVARHPVLLPPRTRVEETALDLAAAALSFDDALGWVSAACAGRLTTPARIQAAMAKRAKMPYRAGLDAALADVAAGANTVLEYRYLRDVERPHGLPRGPAAGPGAARRPERVPRPGLRRLRGRGENRRPDGPPGDRGVAGCPQGQFRGRGWFSHTALQLVRRERPAVLRGPAGRRRAGPARLAGPAPPLRPGLPGPRPDPARVRVTRAGHGQAGGAGRA
jgi:hypothetical protein